MSELGALGAKVLGGGLSLPQPGCPRLDIRGICHVCEAVRGQGTVCASLLPELVNSLEVCYELRGRFRDEVRRFLWVDNLEIWQIEMADDEAQSRG